jgi:hypothetical protein
MQVDGSGRGLIEILRRRLPEELRKAMESLSDNSGIPTEIRTENLPNTSLKRYR